MASKSLEYLKAGYAEQTYAEKHAEAEQKKARSSVELNEIEQRNPIIMMARGYQAMAALTKPEEQIVQLGAERVVDEETAEAIKYRQYVEKQTAQLDNE